ncbi:hypothetical protein UPYG_G00070510 [Umbra pygmaea]|uniref:Telomeric repeat-binding factor n=1 Tax=Umbra pygmaea TaxID=75934 RepID=A0ABD0XBG3_UMBPY
MTLEGMHDTGGSRLQPYPPRILTFHYCLTDVVKRWMIDFAFVSLCGFFKDAKFKEFNETILTLETVIDGMPHLKADQKQKRLICAFLMRVIHGKHLDVLFNRDERLTPLMSAVGVWASLKDTVANDTLFEHVTNLLYVQSVAVCLEKGNIAMASSALKWLEEDCEISQNFGIKLSLIVRKRDTYHPFLSNFSWSRLLENIQMFLDSFLEEHPSDFLIQAATKVVQATQEIALNPGEDTEKQEEPDTTSYSTEHCKKNQETAMLMIFAAGPEDQQIDKRCTSMCQGLMPKKKLLSTRSVLHWNPDSSKKPAPNVRRKRVSMRLTYRGASSPGTALSTTDLNDTASHLNTTRRTHRKWSWDLDRALKAGVKRHGEGKWSRILLEHDFQGRTGVQLKDRWRVLKRTFQVNTN